MSAPGSPATPRPPEVAPWRQRNFRLVWAGGLVNNLGDWLLRVALPVYVFTETGSGTTTAVLFVVEVVLAVFLGPVGGAIVDRCDLRRLLIATNLAQAAALLPLLAVTPDRIWPAYLVTAAQSALTTVNNPAATALLPRLVAPDQLAVANAANSTSASLARLVGSPLGGIVVGLGGLGPVVLVDGLSFLAVGLATWFVRADTAPVGDHEQAGVRAGLHFVRRERRLRRLLEAMTVAQLAQGFFVVLFVVFVVDELDAGGTGVGVIRGTMAAGAIVGAAIVARFGARADPLRLLVIGYAGMGLVAFVFWNTTVVTTTLWVYVLLFSASGSAGRRAHRRVAHHAPAVEPARLPRPGARRVPGLRRPRGRRRLDRRRRPRRPRRPRTCCSTSRPASTSSPPCWWRLSPGFPNVQVRSPTTGAG